MFDALEGLFKQSSKNKLTDNRNVALYVFAIIVLAIAWSTVKTVQKNYDLQKQIATLNQQNAVLKLQNDNTGLRNQFLTTDQYLDLAARQSLGLAAPDEKVLIVPKSVAMKYVDTSLTPPASQSQKVTVDTRSRYVKNIEAWRDFLLGRKVTVD